MPVVERDDGPAAARRRSRPALSDARSPARTRAPRRCRAASSGTSGCSLREALDVQLVDERLVPRRARRPVVAPGERRIDDRRQRRVRRRCRARRTTGRRPDRRRGSRTARRPSASSRPIDLAYGSSTTLLGLKRWPLRRLVRAVDAIAVELAGPHVGQVAVPDHVGLLGQRDARRFLRRRRPNRTGRARPWSRARRRARN